ncbi:MAG TPA: hypothetical protein VFV38_34480, partial [Ktedonobacteraceae bacterium]|nr:hypothetical protein [Ktedonobacteraceae bacterium]
FIQQAASGNVGSTTCWDKELEMNLVLDPTGKEYLPEGISPGTFGVVHIWVDSSYLRPDVIPPSLPPAYIHGRLLTPAQQVVQAFTHWAGVLCDYLAPLFALGEEPVSEQPARAQPTRSSDELVKDVLAEGRVSESRDWPFLVYVAPQFLNGELLWSIYASSDRWVKRTRHGGLLIVSTLPRYAYETGAAYRQMQLGEAIERQFDFPDAEAERAVRYFERARGIFAQIPSERDAGSAQAAADRISAGVALKHQFEQTGKAASHLLLLLDADIEMEALSQDLAHILETQPLLFELPGKPGTQEEQTREKRTLYKLNKHHLSLLLKKRAESSDDNAEGAVAANIKPDYRYELLVHSTTSQVSYDSPQEWLSALEARARSIFQTLKEQGKYPLALVRPEGTILAQFEGKN